MIIVLPGRSAMIAHPLLGPDGGPDRLCMPPRRRGEARSDRSSDSRSGAGPLRGGAGPAGAASALAAGLRAVESAMALDPELVAPGHTAVVINEMQRGTVGDRANLPMLVDAGRPAVAGAARLVRAARSVGVEVLHCVAASR